MCTFPNKCTSKWTNYNECNEQSSCLWGSYLFLFPQVSMGLTVSTILTTVLVISVLMEESAWMGLIPTTVSAPQSGLVSVIFDGLFFKSDKAWQVQSNNMLFINYKARPLKVQKFDKPIVWNIIFIVWGRINVCRDQWNKSDLEFPFLPVVYIVFTFKVWYLTQGVSVLTGLCGTFRLFSCKANRLTFSSLAVRVHISNRHTTNKVTWI